ncbi:hypothetical protein KNE206_75710 [Kitasatospora sp. NE20-6]
MPPFTDGPTGVRDAGCGRTVRGGEVTRRPWTAAPPCDARLPVGQAALQETVGQVQFPFAWTVTPQLLPLPFGFAVSTCALG